MINETNPNDLQIIPFLGATIMVKGGERDITVKLSELEYCIAAIRALKGHKASFMLEQIVARSTLPEPKF